MNKTLSLKKRRYWSVFCCFGSVFWQHLGLFRVCYFRFWVCKNNWGHCNTYNPPKYRTSERLLTEILKYDQLTICFQIWMVSRGGNDVILL